ncbi:TPA: conjugal transfer protein TraF, partial [Legionella pneumophila]|nr:conjugal transfer protein TraF [Legionella pneumophila]
YHMTVIPIAMTNRISPMLPNSRVDSGQATQMGVKHIPAVFALNPVSKKTMPVAYGLVSQSELKENILMASNAFQSGDYNAQ